MRTIKDNEVKEKRKNKGGRAQSTEEPCCVSRGPPYLSSVR